MRRPATLKRRLVLAAIGAVAITLALITLAFNAVIDQRLTRDAQSVVHSRVQAGLAVVSHEGGQLKFQETPKDNALDERVWVFQGSFPIEEAHAPAEVQAAVAKLATVKTVTTRDVGSQRLLAHPIRFGGRRVGAVVGTVSLLPYRHTRHIALIGSILLSLVILAALAVVAQLVVGRALRPVAEMTSNAAAWSEHDLDRRFALGPPRDELTGLAATLDALLGRLSASLRYEKRFSAEVAHELRTPLSQMRAEAELALARERSPGELRDALAAVVSYADRMTGMVNALMSAAEREADPHSGTVEAGAVAEAAIAACAESAAARGIALTPDPAAEAIEVDSDADLAVQTLLPLLSNAIRYGRSDVHLSVSRDGEAVAFRVTDDGPGLDDDELEAVFEPGVRGTAGTVNGTSGAGLGLALARRLARTAGGDVVAEHAESGGRFVVRLPAS